MLENEAPSLKSKTAIALGDRMVGPCLQMWHRTIRSFVISVGYELNSSLYPSLSLAKSRPRKLVQSSITWRTLPIELKFSMGWCMVDPRTPRNGGNTLAVEFKMADDARS